MGADVTDVVKIEVAGFTLNTDVPDAGGVIWSGKTSGWDSPSHLIALGDRTGSHGSTMGRFKREAWTLSVDGWANAGGDQSAAWDAFYALAGALADGSQADLVLYEDVPKSLRVRRGGRPLMPSPVDGRFSFSLDFMALDPFKRGLTASTVAVGAGSTVSTTHAGTAAAEVEVTLTSPGTVDLSIGGLRLRAGALPSGAVLTSGAGFANRRRSILSAGGVNLADQIVSPMQWPAVARGVNSIVNAGSAAVSLKYFPTYS